MGISVSSKNKTPYPEVSGYYIPTLIRWGKRDLAVQYAKWLCSIQKGNGTWHDPSDANPYVFDTAQIIKGLIAISDFMPEVESNIIKACDWIINNINSDGRLVSPSTAAWGDTSLRFELIHLYCLSPLIEAGKKYHKSNYENEALRVKKYYISTGLDDILNFNLLSHFYAYIIEGLIDLGEVKLAEQAMEKVAAIQDENGTIPAYNDVNWTCSTGLFQFALIFYKLGNKDSGDKAFDYAISLQNRSGGWFGGYSEDKWRATVDNRYRPNYFSKAEISWAIKYFLDALSCKILIEFEDMSYIFSDKISTNDGRYIIVRDSIKRLNVREGTKKILDAGCGKGRYLYNLLKENLDFELYGYDISLKVMKDIPKKIFTKQGSLLNLPYASDFFDFVYAVESLEHAINIDGALRELIRVLKDNGYLLIIDKNIKKKGALEIEKWEQWFYPNKLSVTLKSLGLSIVFFNDIPYEDRCDGLFFACLAKKV
jgi:malonyl-CoA O-methyltransferase